MIQSLNKLRKESDKVLFDEKDIAEICKALTSEKYISPNFFQSFMLSSNAELGKAMNEFQLTQSGGQGIFKRIAIKNKREGSEGTNSSTDSIDPSNSDV